MAIRVVEFSNGVGGTKNVLLNEKKLRKIWMIFGIEKRYVDS